MLLLNLLHSHIDVTSNSCLDAHLDEVIGCSINRLDNFALILDFVQKKINAMRKIGSWENFDQMKVKDHKFEINPSFYLINGSILGSFNSFTDICSVIEINFLFKLGVRI